jgi:hypothetical protein
MLRTTFIVVCFLLVDIASAEDAPKRRVEFGKSDYVAPPGLVFGGAFIDRLLPIPADRMRSDVWGGDNVLPRNPDNGLEDAQWSYWCMDPVETGDGLVHLFACRWLESSPKGHMTWPNSTIVRAVAKSPLGPFKVVQEVGPGHNVMVFRTKAGAWRIYKNQGGAECTKGYRADSLTGSWRPDTLVFDTRGLPEENMWNLSFVERADGSVLMVSREGKIWVSPDGDAPFAKITSATAYPPIRGSYEDPVIWQDEVQYHMLVNDWFGRSTYYLRSRDGVEWVWDQGRALDVNIGLKRSDGSYEKWFKYERPNVRQDPAGRATHLYLASVDSLKQDDVGSDKHSSKIIVVPIALQRRLKLQPAADGEFAVLLKAEEGFNPQADLDPAALRFGAPSAVDFGRGATPLRTENSGPDLRLVFASKDLGFLPSDYCGKLLEKDRSGGLVHGYVRRPGEDAPAPLLSAAAPKVLAGSLEVGVTNFGLGRSPASTLRLRLQHANGRAFELEGPVATLAPYQSATVRLPLDIGRFPSGTEWAAESSVSAPGCPALRTKCAITITPL